MNSRPAHSWIGVVVALTAAGCGVDAVEDLSDGPHPPRVEFGSRWVGADRGLVAFCRSDEDQGTCSRVYFAGEPADGIQATFQQAQRGDDQPCRNGAIPFSAPLGIAIEGEADWDGPDGEARLAFTVSYDDGVQEVFRATIGIGTGPCP